jgi:hypothetical protein
MMTGSRPSMLAGGRLALCAGFAAVLLLPAGTTHGQQAPAAPPTQEEPAPQPKNAPEPDRSGFIGTVGHWIENSVTNWNSGLKDAAGVAKDAAGTATGVATDAAKGAGNVVTDTAGAVARIPATRVIAQRATCPVAPNGAPDCRAAAEAICKAAGFASGNSIDFQTAEKCPPVALNRPDGEPPRCVIESYVTRALCSK